VRGPGLTQRRHSSRMIPCPHSAGTVYAIPMGALLYSHVRALLDAIDFAWPATAFGLRLHTPQPTPPVDDDDDDEDDKRGGGSGGGDIDPDDDEGSDDDDEDDEEDTLWARQRVKGAALRR